MKNSKDLLKKIEDLKVVERALNKEFVGLETQIKQVINLIKPWVLMPETIDRPLIINLWGMTGVGKTSFVRRLVDLLKMRSIFHEFDMGNFTQQHKNHESLFEEFLDFDNSPNIILLDEFQSVKTISEDGYEVSRPLIREIWSLLSDGLVTVEMDLYELKRLLNYQKKIHDMDAEKLSSEFSEYSLERFFAATQGILYKDKNEFIKDFESDPHGCLSRIMNIVPKLPQQKTLNLQKSLIFVSGNLDEVFSSSLVTDPDLISADELHKITKKISTSAVKRALIELFRPEQVARLGSNHIIYPSLSGKSFNRLIEVCLNKTSSKFKKLTQIPITFDSRVKDIIFQEGVVPAQGTRPLFSCYHDLIETQIPNWVVTVLSHPSTIEKIKVTVTANKKELLVTAYGKNSRVLLNLRHKLNLKIVSELSLLHPEPLRTLIAYHEAAHAIVGFEVFKIVPLQIKSKTSVDSWGGFVSFPKPAYETKRFLLDKLCYTLAGFAAEKIKFGADNVSTGAYSDLREATNTASAIVTEYGMGSHIGKSLNDPRQPQNLHSLKKKDDTEIESLLQSAMGRAEQILMTQKPLYLALAQKLKTQPSVSPLEFKELVKKLYRK